jgi:hypothetical protein
VYQLTSAGDDETFKVEKDVPHFGDDVDAEGNVVRILQTDPRGTISITLKQSSPDNGVLNGMLLADVATTSGIFPVMLFPLKTGRDVHVSTLAWIEGPPVVGYGKRVREVTWRLRCANPDSFIGGSV